MKIRSLAIVSILTILFSGAADGFENPLANYMADQLVSHQYVPYYPSTIDYTEPNLFIGGILQSSPNADVTDQKWKDFAYQNKAIFIPTYYSTHETVDITGALDMIEVNKAAASEATDLNGLTRNELGANVPCTYGTIIGYSGGTATVMEAMANQNVKADTLILISPMKGIGRDSEDVFEEKIQSIISANPNIKILVFQSPNDVMVGQYDFLHNNDLKKEFPNNIEVYSINLENCGLTSGHIPCHNYFFDTWAKENIKDGRYVSLLNQPPSVQVFQVTPLSLTTGESFTIEYMVSDNGGSGLKQVELWRKDDSSDWQQINTKTLAGETGSISGSFTDSASAPGKYWYGVHVVDNAGNWNDEKNSNTNYQPVSFELVEVEVNIATGASSNIPANAIGPDTWIKTLNGTCGYSVQQTDDGGYIIGSSTPIAESYGDGVLLIKTDANGNEVWEKAFSKSRSDWGNSVRQTIDGGYIITTGMFLGIGKGIAIWLIKADASGNMLWNKTFAGTGGWAGGREVRETTDGGYIILYDCCLIKTDPNGIELWNRTLRVDNGDSGASVRQTMDEGYIITGSTGAFHQQDALLIKTDISGNELWRKTFGKNTYLHIYDDEATSSIEQTDDGGYIMTGFTYGSAGTVHIWLIKTDADGNELWNRTFGEGIANSIFEGTSVQQTKDGGYIIAGRGSGIYLIKTDASGQQLWWKTFYGDSRYSVQLQQTIDGGYILAGSNERSVLLIKTDANGNVAVESVQPEQNSY